MQNVYDKKEYPSLRLNGAIFVENVQFGIGFYIKYKFMLYFIPLVIISNFFYNVNSFCIDSQIGATILHKDDKRRLTHNFALFLFTLKMSCRLL